MQSWWPSIGETSILIGSVIGLTWGLVSTAFRRRRFLRAAIRPVGQFAWFLLHAVGIGGQVTLASALGLMSLHGQVPTTLLWFLLGISCLSFMAALSVASVAEPGISRTGLPEREPLVEPPAPTPLRRSA